MAGMQRQVKMAFKALTVALSQVRKGQWTERAIGNSPTETEKMVWSDWSKEPSEDERKK